jgi:8-oxo-dGTP pyrophosphatase MutT (NUDIX family)
MFNFGKKMPRLVKDASYGAVILSASGKVLLIKQLSKNGNYWALPRGHKDDGESDEAAAIREVNEECGLSLTVYDLVPNLWYSEAYKYNGCLHDDAWLKHKAYPCEWRRPQVLYDKTVFYGLALVAEELPVKPQENEVEVVEWFPLLEAVEKLRHESQRIAVQALCTAVLAPV